MYTPAREAFIAAADRGNLIPVYRELGADSDTPVSAYAALGQGVGSFLLESVVGGASDDTVTLGSAVTSGRIDLGDGGDKLTLAGAANTVTVSNVETVTGGAASDTVTVRDGVVRAEVRWAPGSERDTGALQA